MVMAVFKETLCKDFIEKYDGVELFKEFTPEIAKLPKLVYKAYYSKKAGEVAQTCIKLGRCTAEQAAALEQAFNERYADK